MNPLAETFHLLLNLITFRLDDSNFAKWNFQIELVLEIHDLIGFVDGSNTCPAQSEFDECLHQHTEISEAIRLWKCTDKLVMSLIIASMSSDAVIHIIGSKTSREAWLNILEHYASRSRSNIIQLKLDLMSISKDGDSVEQYMLKYKRARAKLRVVGVEISDEDMVVLALNGLPKEFDMIKTIIIGRECDISMAEFRSHLLVAENIIENRKLSTNVGTSVSYSVSNQHSQSGRDSMLDLFNAVMVHCRDGFISENFHATNYRGTTRKRFNGRNNYRRSNGYFRKVHCQICHQQGHVALNCNLRCTHPFVRNTPSTSVTAITSQTCHSTPSEFWTKDNDETNPVPSDTHKLSMLQHVSSNDIIRVVIEAVSAFTSVTNSNIEISAQMVSAYLTQTRSENVPNGILVHSNVNQLSLDSGMDFDKLNYGHDLQDVYSAHDDLFTNQFKCAMELLVEVSLNICKSNGAAILFKIKALNDDGLLLSNHTVYRSFSSPQYTYYRSRTINPLHHFSAADWDGDPKAYKQRFISSYGLFLGSTSISCLSSKQWYDVRRFAALILTWLFLSMLSLCTGLKSNIWKMVNQGDNWELSCTLYSALDLPWRKEAVGSSYVDYVHVVFMVLSS